MTTATPISPFQGSVLEPVIATQGVALGYRIAALQASGKDTAVRRIPSGDAARRYAIRRAGFHSA